MKRFHSALWAFALLLALCAASRALAHWHPYGDPQWSSKAVPRLQYPDLPEHVRSVLDTKCGDCHSANVSRPWYGYYAPVSWLLERDIIQARRQLDLSKWEVLNPDRRSQFMSEIAGQARPRQMPPLQYRVIHWDTHLTAADIATLDEWAGAKPLEDRQSGGPSSMADAAHGKLLFERRCIGCHSLTSNREGPFLAGVGSRKSGQAPGYRYSKALRNAAIPWNEANLERWLADPDAMVPGNEMDAQVDSASARRDIAAYLVQIPPPQAISTGLTP